MVRISNKRMVQKKKQHGGKRKGSGRKKGEPTKLKRIPVSLVKQVDRIVREHRKKTTLK